MAETLVSPEPRIALRFATPEDVGLILDFSRQLADYEKLSHEVVANEASVRASLFEGRQIAEVIIASWDGEPAGFALFFHSFSTFLGKAGIYLEDLFVIPKLRGRGIGRVLLSSLATLAIERGCGRIEWSVLDWNQPAIRFYERLGAKPMEGWTTFRVTGKALVDLASDHS
jgi:GNAT superfamily N-acetyltransferase